MTLKLDDGFNFGLDRESSVSIFREIFYFAVFAHSLEFRVSVNAFASLRQNINIQVGRKYAVANIRR